MLSNSHSLNWIIICFLLGPVVLAAKPQEALKFSAVWEISEIEPESLPAHQIGPEDITNWQALSSKKVPEGINKTIWIRNRLPDTIPSGYSLYIANGLEDVAIYIGSQKIYEYGNFERKWNEVSSQRWHLLPLLPEWSGAEIHLRYHYSISYYLKTFLPSIRPSTQVYDERIANYLLLTVIVGGFVTLTLISILLTIARKRIDIFTYFGIVTFAVAVWISFNQDAAFKQYFGINPRYWASIDVYFLFLGVSAFFNFIYEISRTAHIVARIARMGPWLVLACSLFLGIFQILHPWYMIPLLHLAAAFGFSTLLSRVIYLGIKEPGEARIFSIGCVGASLSGIHDILRYIDGFPQLAEALIPYGIIFLFATMGLILSRRFAKERLRAIRNRERVIEEIEARVEAKTRDIRSFMNYIPIGIFAITKDKLIIHKDFSQQLNEIFEGEEIAGRNGCDLLFSNSNLGSDQKSQAQNALESAIGEDKLLFETNSHCLPSEIIYSNGNHSSKILELTWNPILDSQNIVEKVLVTVRDTTLIRALREEANDKKEELKLIGELINVPADVFSRFVQSCHEFIAENRKLLNSACIQQKDFEILKDLFINMHTMKGAARSFHFKKMTQIFHEVEQYYAELQKDQCAHWDVDRMRADLEQVEKIVTVYETINREKLGRQLKEETTIEISESEATKILNHLQSIELWNKQYKILEGLDQHRQIQSQLFSVLYTPAQSIIKDIFQTVHTLAKDLGKPAPQLQIDCQNFYLNSRGENLARKIFVHILRNSMDHGIENAEERRKLGKAEIGCISLSMRQSHDGAIISYCDDGQGLNIEEIRQTAIQKQLIPADSQLSHEDCAQLIFHTGLSTASRISDISGRGVGMEAVRKYLLEEGGNIEIRLDKSVHRAEGASVPFHFEIFLPEGLFARLESAVQDEVA